MIQLLIPKHFEQLGIMATLKKIFKEYLEQSSKETNPYGLDQNFYEYNKSVSVDPVRALLEFLIIDQGDQNLNKRLISYYVHKLYSLRGTLKIFDVLKEMESILGFKIGSYRYTTHELKIEIDTIRTPDLARLQQYLSGFFGALLYYQDIKELINEVILQVTVNATPNLLSGASFFTELIVDEEIYEN